MDDQSMNPELPPQSDHGGEPLPPQDQHAMDQEISDATQGGELLPPDMGKGDAGQAEAVGLDFDDLPDPPGDAAYQEQTGYSSTAQANHSLDAVLDVPVKVQAVLGRAKMPIAELVAMHPGYVFELDRRVGEPIDILVNDRLIARGEIVMIDGSLGVTLTEIVKQDA